MGKPAAPDDSHSMFCSIQLPCHGMQVIKEITEKFSDNVYNSFEYFKLRNNI
jgi:hypothetical protein